MNTSLKPSAPAQLNSLNHEQWLNLAVQQAPRAVTGLAVVGIAWQAAQLTWLVLTPEGGITSGPAPAVIATPAATTTTVNAQTIADAHLFGLPNTISAAADPASLPQTQMSLVLAGTIALNDPKDGYAIVGENAANAKFYKVGATINGAARLHSVYADRVIIERAGTLETLVLPHGPNSFAAPAPRVSANNNSAADNLRRLAATNPSALGQLLRAQPVFTNGTQKGYRVYPAKDRLQFARLGLQPGDLITAINGTPLDDPNRSSEILNTMSSSSSVTVSVERNGSIQQLTLDMAQISVPEASASSSTAAESSSSTTSAEASSNDAGGPPRARSGRGPATTEPIAPSVQPPGPGAL
jgi:general secretion pathway protein C